MDCYAAGFTLINAALFVTSRCTEVVSKGYANEGGKRRRGARRGHAHRALKQNDKELKR
jgi:hypothetical protein